MCSSAPPVVSAHVLRRWSFDLVLALCGCMHAPACSTPTTLFLVGLVLNCPRHRHLVMCGFFRASRHLAKACPAIRCDRCGRAGHMARECSKGGNMRCYECGENGHVSRDCPMCVCAPVCLRRCACIMGCVKLVKRVRCACIMGCVKLVKHVVYEILISERCRCRIAQMFRTKHRWRVTKCHVANPEGSRNLRWPGGCESKNEGQFMHCR